MDRTLLERLFPVEAIDSELATIRHDLEMLRVKTGEDELCKAVERLNGEIEGLARIKKNLVKSRDLLESRSSEIISKVKNLKLQEDSGAISHRDFASTEQQIAHLEEQRSLLEDEELTILDSIDSLESEITQFETELNEVKSKLLVIEESNKEKTIEMNELIAQLVERRIEAVEGIMPELLSKYDIIQSRVGSKPIARIENSSCDGCRMKLAASEIAMTKRILSTDFSSPPTCEQCGRMLFI